MFLTERHDTEGIKAQAGRFLLINYEIPTFALGFFLLYLLQHCVCLSLGVPLAFWGDKLAEGDEATRFSISASPH